jgi:hypothetical protein
VEAEAERFRGYHASKDSRFRDWTSAWLATWIGNAIGYARRDGRIATSAVASVSEGDVWRGRLQRLKTASYWNISEWGPKPGGLGCEAPTALLAEFGHLPGVVPLPARSAS